MHRGSHTTQVTLPPAIYHGGHVGDKWRKYESSMEERSVRVPEGSAGGGQTGKRNEASLQDDEIVTLCFLLLCCVRYVTSGYKTSRS